MIGQNNTNNNLNKMRSMDTNWSRLHRYYICNKFLYILLIKKQIQIQFCVFVYSITSLSCMSVWCQLVARREPWQPILHK